MEKISKMIAIISIFNGTHFKKTSTKIEMISKIHSLKLFLIDSNPNVSELKMMWWNNLFICTCFQIFGFQNIWRSRWYNDTLWTNPWRNFSKILRLRHLWIGNFLKLTLVVSKYLRNDSKIGRNQILWPKVGASFSGLL